MVLRLFRALMPKEERFVEHFTAHAHRLVAASDALAALMAATGDARELRMADLGTIEREADAITHETMLALHRAFITPFDRSDIHALINALDDAVDLIEEVGQHAELYRVTEFTPHMHDLAVVIQNSARLLCEVMPLLTNIGRNADRINGLCDQVGRLESDADVMLRDSLSDLIARSPEVIAFLGQKEVYERLEEVTDRCSDVADIIEGIVLDQV